MQSGKVKVTNITMPTPDGPMVLPIYTLPKPDFADLSDDAQAAGAVHEHARWTGDCAEEEVRCFRFIGELPGDAAYLLSIEGSQGTAFLTTDVVRWVAELKSTYPAAFKRLRLAVTAGARIPGRLAYSPEEVMRMLGIGKTLMYDLLAQKKIGSIRAGRRRLITQAHLDTFLAGGK